MHFCYSSRLSRFTPVSRMVLAVLIMLAISKLPAHSEGKERSVKNQTSYRTIKVDGLSIFYREAGPKDAPTLLLLHGLPSSSRMFEPLFSRLSDHYHLVAPDYPVSVDKSKSQRIPALLAAQQCYSGGLNNPAPQLARGSRLASRL
jgi:hypothetical protein